MSDPKDSSDFAQTQEIPIINIDEYKKGFEASQEEWKPLIEAYLPDFKEYFLSPDNFELIQELLSVLYPPESHDRLLDWEKEDIKRILGKIMIPDSIRPTYENAIELARRLYVDDKPNILLLELCTGAGISTMMTWNEMKKAHPEKTCCLVSTDIALESTIIAEILLRLKNIPVTRVNDLADIDRNFDGVVLLHLDASEAVRRFVQRNEKFDAVVSDHGIGYFEKDIHKEIVRHITDSLLADQGIFSVCALENDIKVALAYLQMIRQILFNRSLMTNIPNSEVPYQLSKEQEIVTVRAINSKDSAGLYSILQKLFYSKRLTDFLAYIKSIARVAKATKALAKEVKSPVGLTHSLLPSSNIEPPPNKQPHSIARTLWYMK